MSKKSSILGRGRQFVSHTPGPWKAEKCDIDEVEDERWSVMKPTDQGDFFIATIENGAPGDCLRTEACNARLMAKSPEMFEFLQEVAAGPYSDSDLASLLQTFKVRAQTIIDQIGIPEVG